ncbi:MAG: hypothetical protein OXS35_09825 [Dehalococcoidia bacterium]|nr:hypothetical protein [Dehalococcoidia bacterium]
MQGGEVERERISPNEGWESIQATLERSRSSMYVAGWPTIMLMWGAIVAIGFVAQFAVDTHATGFAEDFPWFPGPLWGGLGLVGMVASSMIGYRASRDNAAGPTATSVGLRVFAFWISVVAAAFIVPAASGLWTAEADGKSIGGIAIGIVSLGYILFGIMHHPAIALVGLGIAAAFYIPDHFAGDSSLVVSAAMMVVVVTIAWVWIRRSGTA